MSTQFEAVAVARRIAMLEEIGAGPLWLRRDAVFDNAAPPTDNAARPITAPPPIAREQEPSIPKTPSRPHTAAPQSDAAAAAWDDDGPAAVGSAAIPIKTMLTLCVKSGADGGAQRYLFVSRVSSLHGAEELFDNILLALGMQKESAAQGDLSNDLSNLSAQIAMHRPSVLILMEPAAALHLIGGEEGAAFESLRGRWHRVGAQPALVTYGAAHLLRNPRDKRKAWDDLCLLTTLQAADVADPE